jgi:phage host-nuclease inhibitor protein Gam
MSGKRRTKTPALDLPANDDGLAALIGKLGEAQRDRTGIETEMNAEIEAVKAKHQPRADANAALISSLITRIQAYAEANRHQLTKGGTVKTKTFSAGAISWRVRPPSVALKGVDSILERLKAAGLLRFIRSKESVDKEAMLKDREAAGAIDGVTIVTGVEDFVITPANTELDEVAK